MLKSLFELCDQLQKPTVFNNDVAHKLSMALQRKNIKQLENKLNEQN